MWRHWRQGSEVQVDAQESFTLFRGVACKVRRVLGQEKILRKTSLQFQGQQAEPKVRPEMDRTARTEKLGRVPRKSEWSAVSSAVSGLKKERTEVGFHNCRCMVTFARIPTEK